MESSKKKYDIKTIYNLSIALISVVFSFCLIFAHEIWRDEGQAWIIARDTPLTQLISVLKHEGHPVLWYLVLMPFAKSGLPCIWLNYISWGLTAFTILFIAIKAPWHPVFKTVVFFSPMFVYWIPVVSRSYALLNFLIILAAYMYQKRKEHPIIFGGLLFLMINTHVIIAGLVGAALLEMLYDIRLEWRDTKRISRSVGTGFMIGVIGCLFMVVQLVGSPGTGDWSVSLIPDLSFILNSLQQVTVIMFSTTKAWQVNGLGVLLVFFNVALAVSLVVRKEWRLLLYYVLSIGFIWYILIFVLYSGNKMYIIYSICLFVLWNLKEIKTRAVMEGIIGVVMTLSMLTGYPNAILFDIQNLYSSGRITADYLNQIVTDEDVVIFYDNTYEGAITPYLNRNIRVWDITEGDYYYYTVWSPERTHNNEFLGVLYESGLSEEQDGESTGYSGHFMTDFFQAYIDQVFEKETAVYLVMDSVNASYFDEESADVRRMEVGSFYGDCRYTGEKYKIYRMVSGKD